MITNKNNQSSHRYTNNLIPVLINQLQQRRQTQDLQSLTKVRQQRVMHHSMSVSQSRKKESQSRPTFNNNTKEGELIDKKAKLIPYVFVPKFKNQTFIMPNRVFEKGKAGKRFYIKMRDTSICSFRDEQTHQVKSVLKKPQKQKTILSRQVQEFNRVIDQNDGRKKAAHNTWCFKNRRIFNYTNAGSEMFSQYTPMNEVKDHQSVIVRKTNLAKTFDFDSRWRPNSRSSNLFNKTTSKIMFKPRSQLSQHI